MSSFVKNYWKRSKFIGTLLLAAFLLPSDGLSETLKAKTVCPDNGKPCLLFDVNFHKGADGKSPVLNYHPDDSGYGPATVQVMGKLNGGELKTHKVIFRYPGDQLGCRDTSVATVGSTETGGLILTDKGVLEIADPKIIIGDKKSLAIINLENQKTEWLPSPSWEMGQWHSSLRLSKAGQVYWAANGRCFTVDNSGLFQTVSTEMCASKLTQAASQNEIDIIKSLGVSKEASDRFQYDLWKSGNTPFLIWRWGVACS